MKNLNLISKLSILAAILGLCLVAVAWVAISSLANLRGKLNQLSSASVPRVLATGEMKSTLLLSVRAQRSAVQSTTDKESSEFAAQSRTLANEFLQQLANFKLSGEFSPEELSDMNQLESTAAKFDELNRQCLDLATQNTNLKATTLAHGEMKNEITALLSTLQTIVASTAAESAASDLYPLVLSTCIDASQLLHGLNEHIDMSSSDPMFATIEASIEARTKELESQVDKVATKLGDTSLGNSLNARVRTIISLASEITRLSKIDSNNASASFSIGEVLQSVDAALALIDRVADAQHREAINSSTVGEETYEFGRKLILLTTAVGLVLGMLCAWVISRAVSEPIVRVRDMAALMASGDIRNRLLLNQRDEAGELARATDSLADSLSKIVGEIQRTSSSVEHSSEGLERASKDLSTQSERTTQQSSQVAAASEELSANINTMSAAAEQMTMNFASISSATEEMSVSVNAISSGAEQTSRSVEVVAETVSKISSSFETVLQDAREGARIAGQASEMAESATRTMQDLDRSGSEISKVTETIKMIALQTNLLALNATIEATSAGEAGKGFAVVANEIKALANQSAKAAEDIARKIEGVQSGTRQSVGVITDIAEIISEINASADRISQSVADQTQSAQTISQNVGEANRGVSHIARSIAEVAATANDMSRNLSEATRGATDVSRSVAEAAHAATSISENISKVQRAAQDTNRTALGITQSADQLSTVAVELRQLVSKFKIVPHDQT